MNKRNIYLVQVDILRKTPMFYTAYLPYSVGQLWAYASQSALIAESCELRELFFLRDPIDDAAARMQDPFFVGFSCYCWNTEYNKALARLIKQRYPNCHIVFGGHDVPPGGVMLEELDYVDFLIHGEGEIPLKALLEELLLENPNFKNVPGISYRTEHGTKTNKEKAAESVEDFPSPYLEGVFDSLVQDHPEIQWSTVWETNRGCPNHCAYCDWGQCENKLRQFPMKRLVAEIEWLCTNKVDYIVCADANFGILERDEDILDKFVQARERTGFPNVLYCITSKNLNERLYRIIDKLNKSGLDKLGPNMAVQSLSPEVLKNIGRKNIADETFAKWIRRFRKSGYRTYTDLILGLPGETLQSFCEGVEKLFVLGQHEGVFYYPCYLLPNSSMATPEYRERFKIRTTRRISKQALEDASKENTIDEFMDMIDQTSTLPHSDWLKANYFMFLTQSVHCDGLLRFLAMFLHTEKIISYCSFYTKLLDFCHKNPTSLFGEVMQRIEENFNEAVHGEESYPLQISGFSFGRMYEDQYFFCRAVLEPSRFYNDAKEFLTEFNLDFELLSQLMKYQQELILTPGKYAEKTLGFDYDFPAYFNAIYDGEPIPLQKKSIKLRFFTPFDLSTTEKYYDKIVRIGRFSSNVFYQTEYITD